jgi:acetate---CoA ligase (ADP-forming)
VSEVLSAGRLTEFFAPRSIAVVGASDTSGWCRFIVAAAPAVGYTGPLIPVHPVHETVFGRPAVPSLRELAEPVDLAFIVAPTSAVGQVLDDAAAAGVRNAVVLASGFRETGPDGAAHERELVATAAARDIILTVPRPLQAGPVGIALQSGALASVLLGFAKSRAIGVSTLATMGNEAMITIADVLGHLVADDATKVICLFLEQITDPEVFAAAAEQADKAGKPIVVLKAGASPVGRQSALAHTGAIAGDDAVVDAVLRQLNVIRVDSIEEMLCTAAVLGYDRRPAGRRMGVVTASGGACDLIADAAARQGLEIPPFAVQTVAAIEPNLPPFATARNPLDVTGYLLANARTSALTSVDRALDAVVDDPGLDFVLFSGVNLPDVKPPDPVLAGQLDERVGWLSDRFSTAPIPVIPIAPTCVDVTAYGREQLNPRGIHLLGGIEFGIRAIGNAIRWSERRGLVSAAGFAAWADARPRQPHGEAAPWSEAEGRRLLAEAGLPVVPGELVHSAAEAADAALRLGLPVAVKACSARLSHKSDVGAVALGLGSADAVSAAYQQVREAAERSIGGSIDGVLVAAMRTGGVELLAGVTVDPAFGPVLAVGLGGVWVETLGDTSLRLLPVDAAETGQMLAELRGLPLLRGDRGGRPADLDKLAEVIAGIGAVAGSLAADLSALEVNPLWVSGDQIEALDVLVVAVRGGSGGSSPRASTRQLRSGGIPLEPRLEQETELSA